MNWNSWVYINLMIVNSRSRLFAANSQYNQMKQNINFCSCFVVRIKLSEWGLFEWVIFFYFHVGT